VSPKPETTREPAPTKSRILLTIPIRGAQGGEEGVCRARPRTPGPRLPGENETETITINSLDIHPKEGKKRKKSERQKNESLGPTKR